MKVLLTAINAKYIHSNLAVYSLRAYAKPYKENVELAEFTINHYTDYIIQEVYKRKPDVLAISCYIWNIAMAEEVAMEIHKILPTLPIWFGGPEVSYDAKERLERCKYLKGIMVGEGEQTFLEFMQHYVEGTKELKDIAGLVYRQDEDIIVNKAREIMDLSAIPFPYSDMKEFENKIIYYESSRGCPYSCSYCLSSIDKKVRLRNLSLVCEELQFFLDQKVPQVKFVDRTFNCNREHALGIWRYIKEHDNGITNFHFEISADILTADELEVLSTMRPGLVQLEIGVQTTNEETIHAINRKMNLTRLKKAVAQVNAANNIHQHLDLIAGLPYEDYETFKNSFNEVYEMNPNQLQLGFLKVLKGSAMYHFSKKGTITYQESAPFEVLFTDWLTYDDVLLLKEVEDMVEIYYNSGQFTNTMKYLGHFFASPFDFFQEIGRYYEANGLNGMSHNRLSRYQILYSFVKEDRMGKVNLEVLESILLYDLYLRENLKSRPEFLEHHEVEKEVYHNFFMEEEKIYEILDGYEQYNKKQISRLTHLEKFPYDIQIAIKNGHTVKKDQYVLFDYKNRNPLDYAATTFYFTRTGNELERVIEWQEG